MTSKTSFWSRPRGPLLLGVAACAACCAPPVAALVVGAGAASTLAGIAEPVAGVLLASAAALGLVIYVRRHRVRANAANKTAASCGCAPSNKTLYSSPEPTRAAPIACTVDLSNKDMVQAGIDAYREAFRNLLTTERTDDGFRWTFRNAPNLEESLRALARAEHTCCSFMKFDVTTNGAEVVWHTRADKSEDAQRALEEYMRLPERLREENRRGHDVAHLKTVATNAGISFTADSTR